MTTPRRHREWEDTIINQTGDTADVDEVLLVDAVESNKGKTLVRMIIDLIAIPNPYLGASVNVMTLSAGVGLVSPEVVLGSINVGIEEEVPQSGWLWRRRLTGIQEVTGSVPSEIHMDIKAQRKLLYGEPRLFLAYTLTQGTSFNVRCSGLIRCLYLLP